MRLTHEAMRARFYARDAACDGLFLAAVISTGIYCLPSCGARKPNEANLRFFLTPREAETAGFRPCRRCRPDDFYRHRDPERDALLEWAARIRENPACVAGVDALAQALAMSSTRLTEMWQRFFHRSPGRFLTEARVDKARHLLATTRERVVEIGALCGYESLSSFNANFRRLTGMSPREYRALPEGRSFAVAFPEEQALAAFALQGSDRDSPCERASAATLIKAVTIAATPAILSLTARGGTVHCRVDAAEKAELDMFAAHAIVLRLLGFAPDPAPFERMARRDPRLSALVARHPGLRIPQTATVFEGLTWAIIGQQINLPFAFRLRRELVSLAGHPAGGGLIAHPPPSTVARLDYGDLERLRFSRRKAEYLIDAARQIAAEALPVEELPRLPADEARDRLEKVRGLGPWSSNYVAMRACAFGDCAPLGDTGLAAGLQNLLQLPRRPNLDETRRLMEEFKPFRSFVTFHLWQTGGGAA